MKSILNHKNIQRIALLMLFFMGVNLSASAQELRTVFIKYREGTALLFAGNVSVYTYKTKAQAERAAEALSAGSAKSIEKFPGFIASAVTDVSDGACYVKMAKDGYMVVDPIKIITDSELQIEVVSTKETNANGDVEYILGTNSGNKEEKTVKMREVESKGKKKLMKGQDMVTPKACGNRLFFPPVKVLVDSAYTRADGRFIVAPIVYKNGKVDQNFSPTVLDGFPYHESQYRRMGYNYDNDKLNSYRANHYMENFKEDTVYTQAFSILNYDKSAKYKGIARFSFENYNAIYHEDTYEWWDGRTQDPMRFLDWDDVKRSIPIDYTRYRYVGRAEKSRREIKDLHVNFAVGSDQIDMSDSATIASIDKIIENITSFYDDSESFIDHMIIRGFASPEGIESSNRKLCKARSASIGNWVRSRFPDRSKLQNNFEYEGDIVPWSEVANYLEKNFAGDEYANEIVLELREIIAANSSLDGQWARIRDREWYPYVNEQVLPHMRRVDIEYSTVTNRVKSPQEIYDSYMANKSGYLKTAKPYEYYELMKRFFEDEEEEELASVAEVAYKSDIVTQNAIRHNRNIESRNEDGTANYYLEPSDWYRRPYPLAAYFVARNKFMHHEVDTVMLKEYIDWSNEGLENQKTWKNQDAGWWNDEAIVVLQILMYCEAHDYYMAHDLCTRHLSDDPKFDRLKMFVRCMDCEWDNPEVRDYIAQSSALNNAVVTMAQNDEEGYRDALYILDNDTSINNNNGNVWYMRAICRFQLEADTRPDALAFFANNCYDPEPSETEKPKDFGAPMLEAFRLDPSNVEYINSDGYFNDSYRLLVWYFYKRQKDGLTMDKIAEEYNRIRSRYYMNNKSGN